MNFEESLLKLELNIKPFGRDSQLSNVVLSKLPQSLQKINEYKVFGESLLAFPADFLNEELEKCFRFIDSDLEIDNFYDTFKEVVPNEFKLFGFFDNNNYPVLLNIVKNTVHSFHIADLCDIEWLKYKLENSLYTLEDFFKNLRPQTIVCLVNNSENYPDYQIFEILDSLTLKNDDNLKTFDDTNTLNAEYEKLIENALMNGFNFHYAPKRIQEKYKQNQEP
jgi:hypothetical protein